MDLRGREVRVALSRLGSRLRELVQQQLRPPAELAIDVSFVPAEQAQVVFFDRSSDLPTIRHQLPAARTLFLRENANEMLSVPAADAVLIGRLSPARLLETLLRLLHPTPQSPASEPRVVPTEQDKPASLLPATATRCSADELLRRLYRSEATSSALYVQSAAGQGWLLDPLRRAVRGNPLAITDIVADPDALFVVLSRAQEPLGVVRNIPYDQWMYWLARFSSGERLLQYADDSLLSVQRGIASPTHGREFARLTVVYGRPVNVAQAAELGRTDPLTVRRFLNASLALARVASAGPAASNPVPPVSEAAAVPAAPASRSGLFSRLLSRMWGRHASR